jgi:hypothetical protein
VDVREVWTYINSHIPSGAIQGVGYGMLKTVDNKEIATSKGYGRGFTEARKVVYPTAQLYSTNSTGRLDSAIGKSIIQAITATKCGNSNSL